MNCTGEAGVYHKVKPSGLNACLALNKPMVYVVMLVPMDTTGPWYIIMAVITLTYAVIESTRVVFFFKVHRLSLM